MEQITINNINNMNKMKKIDGVYTEEDAIIKAKTKTKFKVGDTVFVFCATDRTPDTDYYLLEDVKDVKNVRSYDSESCIGAKPFIVLSIIDDKEGALYNLKCTDDMRFFSLEHAIKFDCLFAHNDMVRVGEHLLFKDKSDAQGSMLQRLVKFIY